MTTLVLGKQTWLLNLAQFKDDLPIKTGDFT